MKVALRGGNKWFKNMKIKLCGLTLAFSIVAQAATNAQDDTIYVNYDEHNRTFQVKHCFQQAPKYLLAKEDIVEEMTMDMRWQDNASGTNQPVRHRRGYARLPVGETGCVHYRTETQRQADKLSSRSFKQQHPDSLLLSIDSWLWQRNDQDKQPLPEVHISHAEHITVSAPWRLISRTDSATRYQMKPSPRYSDGYLALGPLIHSDVNVGGANLRLAVLAGRYKHKHNFIASWVKEMASSVAAVSESFPITDVQVIVVLVNGQGGAVPWGQVNRAGGDAVLFVVNANQSESNVMSDWTAAHEFSHLLTPYTPNDRWLSEGFASYHQNISRLRTGLLDEKTAWRKLLAGFERGKKSAAKQTAPVLKDSNRKHNMQMYWGGAVIALKADVALQSQSDGRMNLSKALAGLQGCCLATGRGWSAYELFTELDRISQTKVFSTLYQQEVKRKSYPAYADLLKELGINRTRRGSVILDDQAPKSAIRKRIEKG